MYYTARQNGFTKRLAKKWTRKRGRVEDKGKHKAQKKIRIFFPINDKYDQKRNPKVCIDVGIYVITYGYSVYLSQLLHLLHRVPPINNHTMQSLSTNILLILLIRCYLAIEMLFFCVSGKSCFTATI